MVKSAGARAPQNCGLPEVPYFLTPDFAERHGVDLGGAVHGGLLTIEDFVALLQSCRECQDGSGRRHEHPEGTDAAPAWCANRTVLEGLRGLV
ncbi:DUF6455 family protein [Defluviimonas sp. WL0002]|uniref:DUF6455 family protein n=1 Tax=Albidovulum marisflavi TaxID=2984159 RepID=A0ABT2ZEZ2_9RHOB|nr:DUF6455 family protein [Defluviimonas sp. WL0002]MCV2869587.1 DUF6455 family protein [Defluviimonas sp. WL0002]